MAKSNFHELWKQPFKIATIRVRFMEDKQKALDNFIANARQWNEFAGRKNSTDCVLRKASALASVLASEQVPWDLESLQTSCVQLGISRNDSRWWNVYYDHLLYYIHIADREAFEFLGDKRSVFMERLVDDVAGICSREFEDDKQAGEFKGRFFKNLDLFQREFGSYKRERTESLVEQVDYQFAKRIAKRLDEEDITVVIYTFKGITAGNISIDIPGLMIEQAGDEC